MMELENRHFVTSNEIISSGSDHQWMKLTNERLMGNFVAEGLGCHHLCHLYQLYMTEAWCVSCDGTMEVFSIT